jgi:hypothetical protein
MKLTHNFNLNQRSIIHTWTVSFKLIFLVLLLACFNKLEETQNISNNCKSRKDVEIFLCFDTDRLISL